MKLLITFCLILISYNSFSKVLLPSPISANSDLNIYYENSKVNGDILYPIFTSSSGTASSLTGPEQPPIGFSQYAFFETSSGHAINSGDQSILTFDSSSPFYRSSGNRVVNRSIEFYYHMHGTDIGRLQVQYKDKLQWKNAVDISGKQQTGGKSWKKITAKIPYDYGLWNVRIIITAKGGYRGDIAITGIKIISPTSNSIKTSCLASSGTITEKIYNENGSLDFHSTLKNDIHIPKNNSMRVNINMSNGLSSTRNYYCDNSGFMGYETDGGDGPIEDLPFCWKRNSGYINCF